MHIEKKDKNINTCFDRHAVILNKSKGELNFKSNALFCFLSVVSTTFKSRTCWLFTQRPFSLKPSGLKKVNIRDDNLFVCRKCIYFALIFPRPANGGRTCVGATFQFQMCNTEECEDIYSDIREEQCQAWDHSDKHNWLPYEHKECKYNQCQLEKEIYVNRQQMRQVK